MQLRVVVGVLAAITACKKGTSDPEWTVSGVANMHYTGTMKLFDKSSGNATECGLDGVWAPGSDNPDLQNAYSAELSKLVDQKVVTFTVVQAAEVMKKTERTTITRGVDACDVKVGGVSVGPQLVKSGWGRAATNAPKEIVDAEAAARAAKAGMWSPHGRELLLATFAKLNGQTYDKLPVTGELHWALEAASGWQPKLAYLDVDIEDVIKVDDGKGGKLDHWKTLPDPKAAPAAP